MAELVHVRTAGAIAVLTLDAPPANSYSYEMMLQLDQAILRARMDDAIQVLVLIGQGEKFFCAGADIRMVASASEGLALERELQQLLFESEEARERLKAYAEKRPAVFKGA